MKSFSSLRIYLFFAVLFGTFLVSLSCTKTLIAFAAPTTETECKAAKDVNGDTGMCNRVSKGCGNGVVYGTCENTSDGESRVCCLFKSPAGNPTSSNDCTQKGGTCEDGSNCKDGNSVICGDCGTSSLIGGAKICCIPKSVSCLAKPTSGPSAQAKLDYTTLENLPGFESGSSDFPTYLKNLYLLALWIVGLSALFMLVLGGFLYLSSAGNTSLISTAKKTIFGALIGLVIALITWLILNTINPDLTTITLSGLSNTGGSAGNNSSGAPTTPPAGGSAGKVLEEAYKMVTLSEQKKCEYSQQSPRNGCDQSSSYPHTDCSDFTVSAYTRAGCSAPPDGTSNMIGVAEEIGDKGSLKAGDAIVYYHGKSGGHVVICENNGCSTYTAAASTKNDLVRGRDSGHMFSQSGLKVLRISKYCKNS